MVEKIARNGLVEGRETTRLMVNRLSSCGIHHHWRRRAATAPSTDVAFPVALRNERQHDECDCTTRVETRVVETKDNDGENKKDVVLTKSESKVQS